ncbi:penicillin-binding transpeptidase domain-containing protein [Escherichia coli]
MATSRFGKRYRDWKKWGHGCLHVTRSLEESADTFLSGGLRHGIDRLSESMGKFGYGHYTGIDLAKQRSGNCQPANGNKNALKNRGIRVTPFRLVSVRVTGRRPLSR